jgi:uridine kinase
MDLVTPVISTDTTQKAHYSPPWADMSMIGVSGSSGSGKTSLAVEIVKLLSLPWVIILSMVQATDLLVHRLGHRVTGLQDSFYKSLTPEQNALAHANEYDLDSPSSIDFDLLVERLQELKQG